MAGAFQGNAFQRNAFQTGVEATSTANIPLPVNCVLIQLYPLRDFEQTVEFMRGKASTKTMMKSGGVLSGAAPSFTSVTTKGFNG